jgi:hypothetical protein
MRLKSYDIISEAIYQGIEYGVRRAHKHDDKPTYDAIVESAHANAMNHLCEVLDFQSRTCEDESCPVSKP